MAYFSNQAEVANEAGTQYIQGDLKIYVNPSSTSTRRADARRNVRNEHDRHTVEWISSLTKRNWKYLAPLAVLLCVGAIVGGIFGSKAATKKEGLTSTNGNNTHTPRFELGTFTSTDVRPWNQITPNITKWIPFTTSFSKPPNIAIGLTHFNDNTGTTTGLNASAEQITSLGFIMNVEAVRDTQILTATYSWVAVEPSDNPTESIEIQVGQYSTLDDRSVTDIRNTTSRRVDFPYTFPTVPNVLVWLNGFEMATHHDWGMNVYATEIDKGGFTIHVDSIQGTDGVLYSGNACWIAYSENTTNLISDELSTSTIHNFSTWDGQLGDKVHVEFPSSAVDSYPPTFLVAFSQFDFNVTGSLAPRLDVRANVSNTAADVTIVTLDNENLRSARVAYIAAFS